ncbi:B12-binding domain-containing radical SAM protein [Thermodesulfobacteriota bacterium]
MDSSKKKPKIIIVAMDEPLDGDAHLKRTMHNAEKRASRQSSRFKGLDLYAVQREVHENLSKFQMQFDNRYMGLLDLMNYSLDDRHSPLLTPENLDRYYSFANGITLNGIYLYQYLRRQGFDPFIVQNYALADFHELLKQRPLAVCLSSTFVYLDDIHKMASQIKKIDPHVPVIAGGILVKKVLDAGYKLTVPTLKMLSTFREKVDAFVVEAQGEKTLLTLLQALKHAEDLTSIPNLALFDEHGDLVFTPREVESGSIDDTAIQWGRIPSRYLRSVLPVTTSRGCYYRCRFCSYHRLFPKVHYKSTEVLREELRTIQRLGFVKHVRFTDDNFTADNNRLRSILKMMIAEGFDFSWSSFARASALTPELVKMMKISGCDFINMGIESGSQAMLDRMDKRLKREQAIEAIKMLNEQGIYCEGGFIIGYPGETEHTFGETIDLINESGLPYYQPFLFYYSKDMPLHEEKEQFELEGLGRAWKHNTMDAVRASELMLQMIGRIPRSYTNGLMLNWETLILLRGEGYHPDEIFDLFRLKRELQLTLDRHANDSDAQVEVDRILGELENRLKTK